MFAKRLMTVVLSALFLLAGGGIVWSEVRYDYLTGGGGNVAADDLAKIRANAWGNCVSNGTKCQVDTSSVGCDADPLTGECYAEPTAGKVGYVGSSCNSTCEGQFNHYCNGTPSDLYCVYVYPACCSTSKSCRTTGHGCACVVVASLAWGTLQHCITYPGE